MSQKTKKIIIISAIAYFVIVLIVSAVAPTILINKVNKYFENEARPYFAENDELQEEIGAILQYKCLGARSEGEKDGLPVCFEVKTEKGDFYVLLWFDTVSYDPDVHEVVKHRVVTSIPDDLFRI